MHSGLCKGEAEQAGDLLRSVRREVKRCAPPDPLQAVPEIARRRSGRSNEIIKWPTERMRGSNAQEQHILIFVGCTHVKE